LGIADSFAALDRKPFGLQWHEVFASGNGRPVGTTRGLA